METHHIDSNNSDAFYQHSIQVSSNRVTSVYPCIPGSPCSIRLPVLHQYIFQLSANRQSQLQFDGCLLLYRYRIPYNRYRKQQLARLIFPCKLFSRRNPLHHLFEPFFFQPPHCNCYNRNHDICYAYIFYIINEAHLHGSP
jgi:hypothetical protein